MFANRVIRGVTVPCVAFYVVAVLAIVAYGWLLRRTKAKDLLAKRIYDHPLCPEVDGWSVTHFVFFGLLGLFYPGQYLQFFLIGVGWEVIETALGQNRLEVSGKRLQLVGDQDAEGKPTGKEDAYWYGKSSDIIVDAAGYALGSAIAERWWPNKPREGRV